MGVFAYAFSDGSEGFDLGSTCLRRQWTPLRGRRLGAANAVLAAWLDLRDALPQAVHRSKSARAAKSATTRA
jgi:hypothetical protein